MRTPVRVLPGVLIVLTVLFAAGCAAAPGPVVTRLPTDAAASSVGTPTATSLPTASPTSSASPTGAATTPPDGATDCADGERTLSGSSQSFVLIGDCSAVTVEGNALTVDASGATIGTLTISGDRIAVVARALGGTTVQGNDITIDAASLGSLTVRGDRNTVSAPGGSGPIVLSGNDNVVTAPSSDVTDDGQRNRIG